jgi:hypothetical protein
MSDLTVLDVAPEIIESDRPRTGQDGAGHWANIAYAMQVLGAKYVLTEDPDTLGPCARCEAQIVRYGPSCTSTVCVACNVLAWVVQS